MSNKEELHRFSLHDRRLLRVAADAAEQSYRRGVQQGAVAMRRHIAEGRHPDTLEQKIVDWRFQQRPYRASIGAPGLGPPERNVTVIDRFQREAAGGTFVQLLQDPEHWNLTRYAS